MQNSRTIAASPALTHAFVLLGTTAGIVAVGATHTQIDKSLSHTLLALAGQGEHIAVVVADNHFAADEIARQVDDAHLKVARVETPHQVRTLVRRLHATRTAYSVAVLIGPLDPFYDQQVDWQVALHLLTDTLRLLRKLARTLRILIILPPAPNATRPYLKNNLLQAVDAFIELPLLESSAPSLQGRLL